jgi:hypothetical protein
MPELLAASMDLLEMLASCSGMPELLAPWKVTMMDTILTAHVSLPPSYGL